MNTRHLFVDDGEIERMEGLRRVVNQPAKHPENPVIEADTPWEGVASVYGTAMYDPLLGRFRLYYLTSPRDRRTGLAHNGIDRAPHTTLAAYAESDDGLHWTKPALGQFDYDGSSANNLLDLGRWNCEGISVLLDERDPDPARRYKAFYWDHGSAGWRFLEDGRPYAEDGACVAFSPDGLRWTAHEGNPVIRAYCDTNQCVVRDPRLERYVAFSRFGFGRKVARSESADFVTWSEPQLVLECDDADGPQTQFYGIAVEIYEGIYLGMVWVYREGTDGRIDTQLACSRDGILWERVGERQTFLPLGAAGTWEDGMVRPTEGVIVRDDRLFIYYGGVQGPHAGPRFPKVERTHRPAIGLAVLRRDGFVSLDAGEEEGYVLSTPFALPEGALHVNATADGFVGAALCDEGGMPLPGFERSQPVAGDQPDATVAWPGGARPPVGQDVRLRLTARRARLYAYWFE